MPKQFQYNRQSPEGQRIAALSMQALELLNDVSYERERLIAMTRTTVPNEADAIDYTFLGESISATDAAEAEALFNEFDSFHGQIQNASAAIKQLAAFAG